MLTPVRLTAIWFAVILAGSFLLPAQEKTDEPCLMQSPRVTAYRIEHESPGGRILTLTAVGDVMMGGRVIPVIRKQGRDYPFDATREHLSKSDLAIANLEAPFGTGGTPFDKKYTFMVPPEFAPALKQAGLDLLTLANNHILDYGPDGLYSTMEVLDTLGLAYCGAGKNRLQAENPAILQAGERRIAFLAYSMTYPSEFWATSTEPGTAYPDIDRMVRTIEALADSTDKVIVTFHWGGELKTAPKGYQQLYAHKAVDAGADMVIGHHPHVLQAIELYRGRLIAYSLGNFVFGSYSNKTKSSAILKAYFNDSGFLLAEVIPLSVDNYAVEFQPTPLEGEARRAVLDELNTISFELNGGKHIIRPSGLIAPESRAASE